MIEVVERCGEEHVDSEVQQSAQGMPFAPLLLLWPVLERGQMEDKLRVAWGIFLNFVVGDTPSRTKTAGRSICT
jgi:hypothetical protein